MKTEELDAQLVDNDVCWVEIIAGNEGTENQYDTTSEPGTNDYVTTTDEEIESRAATWSPSINEKKQIEENTCAALKLLAK
eukprot:snap_masked-scaffold_95-processed-gene-0.7-mRNA-1 protein AED:1.00 eAED:1.00 QI:0/0/0/0/1/1/2/0/80